MRTKAGALAASAVFFVVAPVMVAGVVPYLLTGWRAGPPPFGLRAIPAAGTLIALAGAVALIDCVRRFALEGRGTPAPIAPTELLVATGPYRYVRNPMYIAVVGALVGQAVWLAHGGLLAYAAAVALGFHAFVVFYEEPALRRCFGRAYESYFAGVPRWIPRRTPWRASRLLTPAALRELATGFQASRVLLTAVELRCFSHIGGGTLTSAQVAERAGTCPRATDRLLNALCVLGLLDKRDGRFANTSEGLRYLVDSSPAYAAGLAHTNSMWQSWSGLTDAVRQGAPALRRPLNDRGEAWLEPFIAAMHYRAGQQADAIAALLPLDRRSRVLDVGGGSGAFAMAMARRAPGLRAVVFDLPSVVPITGRYVAAAGFSGAVTTMAGDYLVDPLPGGFDLVFLCAVVHSNSSNQNAALLARCAASLVPGGSLAVVDWIMSPDRLAPASGALFALNMLVATDEGDTFTEGEIREWMSGAGLSGVRRLPTPFGTDIVIGVKGPAGP